MIVVFVSTDEPQRQKVYLWTCAPSEDYSRIRAVWSESSLGTLWIAKDAKFPRADNWDSNQTARMCRLVLVFVVRTCKNVRFLTLRLKCAFWYKNSNCLRGMDTHSGEKRQKDCIWKQRTHYRLENGSLGFIETLHKQWWSLQHCLRLLGYTWAERQFQRYHNHYRLENESLGFATLSPFLSKRKEFSPFGRHLAGFRHLLHEGDNFSDFLFAALYTNPLPKRDLF